MNFDGTYPERPEVSEKQRMIDNANCKEIKPPVRVIVSYPQSEEWDGKPIQQWRKYWFWIGIVILTSSVAFGSFYVLIKYFKHSFKSFEIEEILVNAPMDQRILVSNYILNYYEEKTRGKDFHTQLEFYKTEFIKQSYTDNFLADFSVPYKNLNINETNDIKQTIISHLGGRKYCLTKLAEEENVLSSYEFQKKPKSRENLEFENCSDEDKSLLEKLKKEYQTPESITLIKDSTLLVQGKVIILKKIKKHLDNDPKIRQLVIIASVLYLDTDITKNIDIAIFAKNWIFITTPIEFNLSGPDAYDNHLEVPDSQAGKSGFDSGFFLAVGLGYVDNETMTVRMDGGNASAGHNGPDGRNGTAGILPPQILEGERHCVVAVEQNFYNPAGEFLQMHAVFDEGACAEAGGLGGPAGLPGKGGEAVFISSDYSQYIKGMDGAGAKNGTDGTNGSSIPGECYIKAYKFVQYVGGPSNWQTVTIPSCHPEERYELPWIPNQRVNQTQQPEIKIPKNITVFEPALKIFSDIARKQLNENNRELFSLLQQIESNERLVNVNSIAELEDEFNTLEKTYEEIEIFQSFARKVAFARKANKNNHELSYLEAMIWSKIATLNTRFGIHYVVDIESYLQETLKSLRKLDTDKSRYLSSVGSKQQEIIKKLLETKKLLLSLKPEPKGANKTDEAITITVHVLPQFVDIMVGLLEKHPEVFYTHLRKTLDEFSQKLDTSCHEDRLTTEQLLTLQKCTGNRPIDRKLLKSFYAIRIDSPLDGIVESLDLIEHELQPSVATTAIGKKWIMNVRVAVLDLSSLLFRIRQSLSDTKLATVVAEITGRAERSKKNIEIERKVFKNLLFEQYLKALDAYKQWAFPYCDFKESLTADATKEDLILATQSIIDTLKAERNTIKARDNHVIEAQFRLSSPIAPFFSWTRQDNDNEIAQLLAGRRVQLRANIADSVHGLSKQAIKFRTAEIFLEGVPESITNNFEVNLTHSGFSHFLYNGTTTTIVGPEIEIVHSLNFGRNGEPTLRNNVYQKIKAGDVFLSPFTTWFVELKGLNDQANFHDFQKYPMTNVHLVGIGRYTSL